MTAGSTQRNRRARYTVPAKLLARHEFCIITKITLILRYARQVPAAMVNNKLTSGRSSLPMAIWRLAAGFQQQR
jgi:hypothetical protein